ncbi:hypothetical protein HanRHA438_Chr04g0179711 [Helianthus annuus]|nr:hypothetical protein HanRHA438_Chr04g0179711 [Helianthus annuus]
MLFYVLGRSGCTNRGRNGEKKNGEQICRGASPTPLPASPTLVGFGRRPMLLVKSVSLFSLILGPRKPIPKRR